MIIRLIVGMSIALALSAPADVPYTLETDFSEGFGQWTPLHTGKWNIALDGSNHVAALEETGYQRGGVRRPSAYLFLPGYVWKDVSISLRAQSLEPATTVYRDIVIIFGYIDDTHYYYAHISSFSDDHHNAIIKVEGDHRTTIHQEESPEILFADGWNTIVVRHFGSTIEVYLNGGNSPMLTATDTTFPAGSIAIGSFDDRAWFDDISIAGVTEEPKPGSVHIAHHTGSSGIWIEPASGGSGFCNQLQSSPDLVAWSTIENWLDTSPAIEIEDTQTDTFWRLVTQFPSLADSDY